MASELVDRKIPNRYYRCPCEYDLCSQCGGIKYKGTKMCMVCFRAQRRFIEQPKDGSIRYIPLTQGQFAIVSVADYDFLNQWNWYATWSPNTRSFYAVRKVQGPNGERSTLPMHRVILGLVHGDGKEVDHVNCNTLDNRRENLRIATANENKYNQRTQRNNKSGFKGVSLRVRTGKYEAHIKADGKLMYLGCRFTAEEAYRELYVPATQKYHGNFARVK
jgi:HNH endonuclease